MKKQSIKNFTTIAIFSSLTCISAYLYFPLIIPITLQLLIIALSTQLLGVKNAVISYTVYFLLGILGLPVFSNFSSGFSALFNTSGGFIIGFYLFIIIKGVTKNLTKNSVLNKVLSNGLALIILYAFGSVWFTFVYYGSLNFKFYLSSLAISVLPFILPDIVKIVVAELIATRLNKIIKKAR